MNDIISIKPARSRRKAPTTSAINPPLQKQKLRSINRKSSSQPPHDSISSTALLEDDVLPSQGNILQLNFAKKKPQKTQNDLSIPSSISNNKNPNITLGNSSTLGNLTKLNLKSLQVHNEGSDCMGESPRKQNFVMKSWFFNDNKARTPTASSMYKFTHNSPICQYFDNSPMMNKVKNEQQHHMHGNNFSRFAGIQQSQKRFCNFSDYAKGMDGNDLCFAENRVIENEDEEDEDDEGTQGGMFEKEVFFFEKDKSGDELDDTNDNDLNDKIRNNNVFSISNNPCLQNKHQQQTNFSSFSQHVRNVTSNDTQLLQNNNVNTNNLLNCSHCSNNTTNTNNPPQSTSDSNNFDYLFAISESNQDQQSQHSTTNQNNNNIDSTQSNSNNNDNNNFIYKESPFINVINNININNNSTNNNNNIYYNSNTNQSNISSQNKQQLNSLRAFPQSQQNTNNPNTNIYNHPFSNYNRMNMQKMNMNINVINPNNPIMNINNVNPYYNQQTMLQLQQFLSYQHQPQQQNINYSPYIQQQNQQQTQINKITMKKISNQNYTTLTDEELAKQAHIISKYQSGCRYLQKKLDEKPELASSLYYPHILEHIQDLSTDQFGNFFIKKILSHLPEEKLLQFIAVIFPILPAIATTQHGARLLQDLIDYLTTDNLINSFMRILIPHINPFLNDQNASHIIHKIVSIEGNSTITELLLSQINIQIVEIAITKKGCNFIQKCTENFKGERLVNILTAIQTHLEEIITNQYGNYIIQHIFTLTEFILKAPIYAEIKKKLCYYANQKYSSNVIEKVFDEEMVCNEMVKAVLQGDNFEIMMLDNYGNYVAQKVLSKADEDDKVILYNKIVSLIPKLQQLSYGQKLLSKLLIQYPKLAMIMLHVSH